MTKSLGYKSFVFLVKKSGQLLAELLVFLSTRGGVKMAVEQITLAKACMDYFSPDRKLTTHEYRDLTHQDKVELREMFIAEGMDIAPLAPPKSETES